MEQKTSNLMDRPIGLTDWAYEKIKESILTLKNPPRTQLQVESLAAEMGISRTPVREALIRLERDGLVQVMPRVGFFVTDFTSRDLEELYEMRELLESRAVRDAVPRLTGDEQLQLAAIVSSSRKAVEQGDVDQFLDTEIAFHSFLTSRSPNRRLIATLDSFRDLTYRWRILSIKSLDYVSISLEEHEKIASAVQQQDAELAGRLMSEHICNARDRILQMVLRLQEGRKIPG